MHAPAILTTDRLKLRPVEMADAQAIFDTYASCEAATRFMPFVRHRQLSESLAFTKRCAQSWQDGSAYPWAITDAKSDQFMGVIEIRLSPPKADFGYIIGQDFWSKGYTSEAARAVVDWAISLPDIHRIWATCHPDNHASAAVLRKAGLGLEATLPQWENRPQMDEVAGTSLLFSRLTAPKTTELI